MTATESAFQQCEECGTFVVDLATHVGIAHGPRTEERECDYCGAVFEPGKPDQRYCGLSCAARDQQRGS